MTRRADLRFALVAFAAAIAVGLVWLGYERPEMELLYGAVLRFCGY